MRVRAAPAVKNPNVVRVELAPHPSAASTARRAALDACAGVDVDRDAIALCTSELVTNALLHGRPPIELEVSVSARGDTVRVEVRDGGVDQAEGRRPISSDTMSGRGLTIVDAIATRWGADATSTGHVAWFELGPAPS